MMTPKAYFLALLIVLIEATALGQSTIVRITAEDKSHKLVTDLKLEELSFKVDGAPVAASSIQYTGGVPVDWVLAVDCTNSMRLESGWRPAIEEAVRSLISSMQERGDRVAVAAISDQPVHLQPFMSDGQELTAAVNKLKPGGASALYDSLLVLADYLKKNSVPGRRQIVWLISDGEDNQSNSPAEKILPRFEAADLPFALLLLGESTSLTSGSRERLAKVARNSGGIVLTSSSKRETVEAANQMVLFSKKEYRVIFPLQVGSRDHKLEAGVNRAGVKLLETKRSIYVAEMVQQF